MFYLTVSLNSIEIVLISLIWLLVGGVMLFLKFGKPGEPNGDKVARENAKYFKEMFGKPPRETKEKKSGDNRNGWE